MSQFSVSHTILAHPNLPETDMLRSLTSQLLTIQLEQN